MCNLFLDSVAIHFSFIGYFALIPVFIFFVFYSVIQMIEKLMHHYFMHKTLMVTLSGVICFAIAIVLIIVAFFV